MTAVQPFALGGPLPERLTVLEASAGTGKTFTIEGLVTRFVAGGTPLPRLLVVTFTRAATAELRDRVRRRLVRAAEQAERAGATGAAEAGSDPVMRWLLDAEPAVVSERQRRLDQALADFDAATISTIHGFCQHVLGGLGLTGDADRTARLIEDEREIIEAVVDDLYVRRFHAGSPDGAAVTKRQLGEIARKVMANADARIVPQAADDPTARLRAELAEEIRSEVARRKRAAGVLSFDDVLTRLADTLDDREHGEAARRRLAQQYSVALVDEFQDTDPVQWRIVSAAFGGDRPLVLIGDPKQAIYAFRGADVYAYLSAAGEADNRATLAVNWRSDGPLLDAYNALFRGARLGHHDIAYRPVQPAPAHARSRLHGAPVAAPLRLRYLPRHPGLPTNGRQQRLLNEPAREHVARDLAAQIVELLDSAATIEADDGGAPVPVRPPHIAVLVRANADAVRVQRHLRQVGVPAVINGVGSVFATMAAVDWLRLLEALEQPASPSRARRAALTCFFGWGGRDVAAADDEQWDRLHRRLHGYAAVLRDRSVASLVAALTAQERLSERLLSLQGGERLLTDALHIGELLHAVGTAEALGPTALATWLRGEMAEPDEQALAEEQARRLESDADAVQVMTIHRSKGLEFPILYCPFAWRGPVVDKQVPVYHDGGQRVVDVGGPSGPEFEDHQKDTEKEQLGEDLRLLYVALTRARHQAVVWWAPYTDTASLARLIFCRTGDGSANTLGRPTSVYDDETALSWLHRLAEQAPGRIAVEQVPPRPSAAPWRGEVPDDAPLRAARFDRGIDHRWRRASYSSITRHHHEPPTGTEPGETLKDDETLPPTSEVAAAPPAGEDAGTERRLRAVPSPLADVGGGVEFGTFVHAVLEEVDFADPDLPRTLGREVERQNERRHIGLADPAAFAGALTRVLDTPLGPLAGGATLRDFRAADRSSELEFELPLATDRSGGQVTVADIASLLGGHVPAGDPLEGYARRLRQLGGAGGLRGYLTGSIDAVLRRHGPEGPAFLVVDYKTNWLGVDGEPLTAWHYRPSALAWAMKRAHYPLQALLYNVALHRHLRARMPGYEPSRHLGGTLYLFLRGMTGPDVPTVGDQPCGVFSWAPPASLIAALSDLLDRGGTTA